MALASALCIVVPACSSDNVATANTATVPKLNAIPSSSPQVAARALGRTAPQTVWGGTWHLTKAWVRTVPLTRLAADSFGEAKVVGHLRDEGMTSAAAVTFDIVSNHSPTSADGLTEILFMGFKSPRGATEFARSFTRRTSTGTALPGVPHGVIHVQQSGGSCRAGTCSNAEVVYPYRGLVVWSNASCQTKNSCGLVADPLGRAIYEALSRTG